MKIQISQLFVLLITITVCLQGCASKTSNPDNVTGKNDSHTSINSRIAKVRVDRAGKIFLNGAQVSLDELKRSFAGLPKDGVVWYYRESPEADPHAAAEAVVQAILEARLSLRLSSKPDYSDVVEPQGLSQPSQ